jgi:hypothetical protein
MTLTPKVGDLILLHPQSRSPLVYKTHAIRLEAKDPDLDSDSSGLEQDLNVVLRRQAIPIRGKPPARPLGFPIPRKLMEPHHCSKSFGNPRFPGASDFEVGPANDPQDDEKPIPFGGPTS